MAQPDNPGVLDRLRARYPLFDRLMLANARYEKCKGDFFAAALSYFTVFAMFPLLMVGFSVTGFVLSQSPGLLSQTENRIRDAVSGPYGQQLIDLMDSAIKSRTSIGVIGLAVAGWVGLSWMSKLREALSEMWEQRFAPAGFVRTKLSDLAAIMSMFIAVVVSILLAVLGDPSVTAQVLSWVGIHDLPLLDAALRAASVLVSVLVSWLLFTWVIARLPRESISFASSIRAALLAAVGFEIFKQIAAMYLRSVVNSPAGAIFGPVLGLMVFAYITARLVLFATAWAATAPENLRAAPVDPPGPAIINPRVHVDGGLSTRQTLAATAMGAAGALGLSRLARRR
jgi:membrane protein